MGVGVAVVPAAAGPYLVKDIATGSDENRGPNSIWFLPGTQSGFFAADTPGYGDALWITDGTEAGTHFVRDLLPALGAMQGDPNRVSEIIQDYSVSRTAPPACEVGGIAYLEVDGQVWKSDGTSAGTEPIASIEVIDMTEFQGSLYIVGEQPGRGILLFRSDGTPQGTLPLAVLPEDRLHREYASSNYKRYVALFPGPSALWIVTADNLSATATSIFQTSSFQYPLEVWRSDGTGAGTQPVPSLSEMAWPTLLGDDLLYFQWETSSRRYELWRSNGTPPGTRVVGSVEVTGGFHQIQGSVVGNGTLYFLGEEADMTVALWKSDGTPEGTVQVFPEPTPSMPTPEPTPTPGYPGLFERSRFLEPLERGIAILGLTVVFPRDNGNGGTELCISDGTTAGTRFLAGPWPNDARHCPRNLTPSNGRVFFAAPDSMNCEALWVTDGTPEGTQSLFLSASGSLSCASAMRMDLYAATLTPFHDGVLFQATDGIHGAELWKSDGSLEGTRMVKDVIPSTNGSSSARGFVEVNNSLLFTGYTPAEGREFWRTDGTDQGTQLVRAVRPGSESISLSTASPNQAVWGDLLLFTDSDPVEPALRLWRTDGSGAGTRPLVTFPLQDTQSDRYSWTGLNFWPSTPSDLNPQLFHFQSYSQIYTVPAPGENPISTYQSEDALYRADGTPGGNYPLKTGWANFLGHAGSGAIFLSDPAYYDRLTTSGIIMSPAASLWTSNGLIEGTSLLAELPGGDIYAYALAEAEGVLYLRVQCHEIEILTDQYARDIYHESLWRTDGTAEGTYAMGDEMDDLDSSVGYLGSLNGRVIFYSRSGSSTSTIWSHDGTREGISPLYVTHADLYPFGAVDGRLLFTVRLTSPPNDSPTIFLWGTDGTAEGTLPIRKLPPPVSDIGGNYLVSRDGLFEVDGRLVFFGEEEDRGLALWSTDGTPEGTSFIRRLTPGPRQISYRRMFYQVCTLEDPGAFSESYYGVAGEVLGGNRFVFPAADGIHGMEMWVTDGTTTGTRLLRDIQPGRLGSGVSIVYVEDDRVYFSANDGATGYELWVTDGTPLGTVRCTDLVPGPGGFSPDASIVHNNTLYFSADDASGIGSELWALPLADIPMPTQTERDILPRILNQPGAPVVDDQNADAALDIADFIRARAER